MQGTWELHSRLILGYVAERTAINEKYVAVHRVQKWIDQGYTDYQIGLLWNTGSLLEIQGVNRYGVPYDSVAYALGVLSAINKFRWEE